MVFFDKVRTRHRHKVYDIEIIAELVRPVAVKHDIDRVYLFGSYARGEATSKSDVDLLIECKPTMTLIKLSRICLDFEDSLRKPVDVVPLDRDNKFYSKVKNDLVLIYER